MEFDISDEKAEEVTRKELKRFKDINNPKDWEVQRALTVIIHNLWEDIELGKSNWDDLKEARRRVVKRILQSIDIDQRTAWEIVDPHLSGTWDAAITDMISLGGKVANFASLFEPHTPKNMWDKDTLGEFIEEYKEWRENEGAWVDALELVGYGAMGLAAFIGTPALAAAATTSAFFIAAAETPYVLDALRRGKLGLACIRFIGAYLGLLSKGWGALKSLSKGAPPVVEATVKAAQRTLKQQMQEFAKNLLTTGGVIATTVMLIMMEPRFKEAYDVTKKAYATSICRGETGTFDYIEGRNDSIDCVGEDVHQFLDRPGIDKETIEWNTKYDFEFDEELQALHKELNSAIAEIDEPLDIQNENVFYEDRFSKLAGV
jgi:hypothetical protein